MLMCACHHSWPLIHLNISRSLRGYDDTTALYKENEIVTRGDYQYVGSGGEECGKPASRHECRG